MQEVIYKIVHTKTFIGELDKLITSIAEYNYDAAVRFDKELFEKIAVLTTSPFAFSAINSIQPLKRKFHHKTYVISYRIELTQKRKLFYLVELGRPFASRLKVLIRSSG